MSEFRRRLLNAVSAVREEKILYEISDLSGGIYDEYIPGYENSRSFRIEVKDIRIPNDNAVYFSLNDFWGNNNFTYFNFKMRMGVLYYEFDGHTGRLLDQINSKFDFTLTFDFKSYEENLLLGKLNCNITPDAGNGITWINEEKMEVITNKINQLIINVEGASTYIGNVKFIEM